MVISVELKTDTGGAADALAELHKNVTDWRGVWREMLPIIAQETARNIQQQGAPLGVSWPALSQSTIRRKRGGRGRTLVRSGRLLRLIEARGSNIQAMDADFLAYGINRAQSYLVHQYGSTRRRIPARPFIGVGNRITRALQAQMRSHLAESLTKAGRAFRG